DKLVAPRFVDLHTHYDGKVTWSQDITPSSQNGVTSAIMGNCGVGFAPCRPSDHQRLIQLMEGVEDIPEPVLSAGLPWAWESFPDYMDWLPQRPSPPAIRPPPPPAPPPAPAPRDPAPRRAPPPPDAHRPTPAPPAHAARPAPP